MKCLAIVLLPMIVASAPARAQDIPPALDPTTMIGYAGTIAADQQARQAFGNRLATRQAPLRAVSVNQFAFRPDAAVRQQVHTRALAQMRRSDPKTAAQMSQELNSGKFTGGMAQYLGRYGMSANNLADTTALYLATSWLATRASSADPSPAQMRGLRRQVAETLASMPALARAGNATKQEWSEANLIQAAFASNIANEAARNPAYASKARPAVARGVMSLYRIDLMKLNLTDRGLR